MGMPVLIKNAPAWVVSATLIKRIAKTASAIDIPRHALKPDKESCVRMATTTAILAVDIIAYISMRTVPRVIARSTGKQPVASIA